MRRVPPSVVRPVAVAFMAGLLAVSAVGCTLVSNQATEIQYSPSDGVDVQDAGPLDVRNALIVANADGSAANFIAAVVNTTDEQHALNVSVGADGDRITLFVPAGSTVSLGVDDAAPLALGDIATIPGATVSMYFQSGDAQGTSIAVPVLDGSTDYLAPFAPES